VVDGVVLPWVFTLAFTALTFHSLIRIFTERHLPAAVVGHVFHLVMSAVMVTMAWPWWETLPWMSQIVVFTLATIWYALIAVANLLGAAINAGPHPWWHLVMHSLMMAAMVWMVAAMPPGAHHHELTPTMATLGTITVVGLVGFGLATISQIITHTRDRHPRGLIVDRWAATGMNLGMAAMCWLML